MLGAISVAPSFLSQQSGCCSDTQHVLFWCNAFKRDSVYSKHSSLHAHTSLPDTDCVTITHIQPSGMHTHTNRKTNTKNNSTFSAHISKSKGCGSYLACHKRGQMLDSSPVLLNPEGVSSHV